MIPQGSTIQNEPVQERQQPSRTWGIDFEKGKVIGMIDGLEAVKQTVFCILNTERFKYLVYSFNYGHELNSLIGKSPGYAQSEINRMLDEALTQDGRIESVEILDLQIIGDSCTAQVLVNSIYGPIEQEVTVNV